MFLVGMFLYNILSLLTSRTCNQISRDPDKNTKAQERFLSGDIKDTNSPTCLKPVLFRRVEIIMDDESIRE